MLTDLVDGVVRYDVRAAVVFLVRLERLQHRHREGRDVTALAGIRRADCILALGDLADKVGRLALDGEAAGGGDGEGGGAEVVPAKVAHVRVFVRAELHPPAVRLRDNTHVRGRCEGGWSVCVCVGGGGGGPRRH